METVDSEGKAGRSRRGVEAYPLGEELANAISHGLGFAFSVAALVILVSRALAIGTVWHVVSYTVFGASLILLYAASASYHALSATRARPVLKTIDHASIYVLIAGTYTPFALTALRQGMGWWLFGAEWGFAAVGIAATIAFPGRFRVLSTLGYALMGWLIVFAWKPLSLALEPGIIRLLIAGGLAYTLGIGFYAAKRLPWSHPIWHLFVFAGSLFHFLAILGLP